jgi:Kef-type K+ transport system membrane component KefB
MDTQFLLWQIFLVFLGARAAGYLSTLLCQPAVIGELLVGILLGSQVLGWVHLSEPLLLLGELGVIFLLFQVGLESDIWQFKKVGGPALSVGSLGVFFPFLMGFGSLQLLGYPLLESLFVGAAMVATSVGITARVLQEKDLTQTLAARVILAAAVFDDVLGLLILGFVVSLARGSLDWLSLAILLIETLVFVSLLVFLAPGFAKRTFHFLELSPRSSAPFGGALIICLGLAWVSSFIGLAAIIGAFLAGLALAEARGERSGRDVLREQFAPLVEFLAPFFFVLMGVQVDLTAFVQPSTLLLLALVLVLAIVGKLLGSYPGTIRLGRRVFWQVGIGMIPRGEVGLIVASIGLGLGVIGKNVYSVVVAMSILTTLLAPPFMRWAFSKPGQSSEGATSNSP